MQKRCPGYKSTGEGGDPGYQQDAHMVENDGDHFSPGKNQCRDCYRVYARDWRAKKGVGGTATRRGSSAYKRPVVVIPDFRAAAMEGSEDAEFVSDEDLAGSESHAYVPSEELIEVWGAVANAAVDGSHPFNIMFLGPSGSGKTEAAKFLAATAGLSFTKVDAASMTDPESWFGTREVVESEGQLLDPDGDPDGPRTGGVSVTSYRPSAFVLAIEEPGVLLLDEINRVGDAHRNILLPLLDGTHQVTNPLTGDSVVKHPKCFIMMSGNRGLNYTGTFAIDPALMSRSLVVNFDYPPQLVEVQIAKEASGCDDETAELFVRFATESRVQAARDPDFMPISTREVIMACRLVKKGASTDLAAKVVVMNSASDEGGAMSNRASLEKVWAGIRIPVPTTRKCGAAHPWARDAQGDEITCAVEVPIKDPQHAANPQHRGASGDKADPSTGLPFAWFDQP